MLNLMLLREQKRQTRGELYQAFRDEAKKNLKASHSVYLFPNTHRMAKTRGDN